MSDDTNLKDSESPNTEQTRRSSHCYVAGVRLDAVTYEDFALLLDALDALDSKAASDGMMGMMLGTMLSRDKDEATARIREMESERKAKAHELRRLKESTAVLRAKLILARRELDAQEADRVFTEST